MALHLLRMAWLTRSVTLGRVPSAGARARSGADSSRARKSMNPSGSGPPFHGDRLVESRADIGPGDLQVPAHVGSASELGQDLVLG